MGEESRKAIGLFWDIENCQVPKNVSALSVVQRLRERFFSGLREAEFMCVCDIHKESKTIIEELNSGQVNVVHISATAKNAADDKIRQSLRRFADTHPPDTQVLLISGDVNFSPELSDLRHRKHMYIIVVHGKQASESLLAFANEDYVFDDIMADLPERPITKDPKTNYAHHHVRHLAVMGFSASADKERVRKRLNFLANNTGGRTTMLKDHVAHLVFPSYEAVIRAKKRMEGEDVCGQRISVNIAHLDSPSKAAARQRSHSEGPGHRTESPGGPPGAPRGSSPSKQYHPQNNYNPNYYSGFNVLNYTQSVAKTSNSFTGLTQNQGEKLLDAQLQNMVVLSETTTAFNTYHTPTPMYQHPSFNQPSRLYTPQTVMSVPPVPRFTPALYNPGPRQAMGRFSFDYNSANANNNRPHSASRAMFGANIGALPPPQPPPPQSHQQQQQHQSQSSSLSNSNSNHNLTGFSSGSGSNFSGSGSNFSGSGPNNISGSGANNFSGSGSNNFSGSGSNFSSGFGTRVVKSPDIFDEEEEEDSPYYRAQMAASDVDKGGSVELTVTNLDYNISKKEWRKLLAVHFQPYVKVLGICVRTQADNTSIATIKVPSLDDARIAISQCHRKKIGYKKISVSLADDRDIPTESTRQETIAVLSDSKCYTMPVFKFIENFERRYHKTVSVSDLYKMKDVVEIMDRGGGGRMVRLARGVCPTPSPTPEDYISDPSQEDLIPPVCLAHCPEGSPQYAEAMSLGMLPNVRLQRKPFTSHVHSLLLSHNGVMPLMSFPNCYAAEFGNIPNSSSESGVPMEHLISCLPGIEIVVTKKGHKIIHFQENKDPPGAEAICGRTSPVLSQQLALLSREIGDVLRQSRTCSIPASKFIPSYHHHFARQCRVADYGYNKLNEVFEALPHVVQVLGTGDRKVLTLCHRAQVKRFITDVLKVLKTQPGRQLAVSDLAQTFERVLFRKFDITHYGVAYIEDMFVDIPATSIMITREGNKDIMAIPKRDQTPEEMKRTEQFSLELVDLLKHNPQCCMTFNKFIPAYHHHFGRQCRVADYGFTRLTDLFENINHVVDILDDEEERMIKLTAPEMRLVLAEQMVGLLRVSPGLALPVDQLLLAFQRQYGFPLRLSDFGARDVKHLLEKVKHCTYIDKRETPHILRLRIQEEIPQVAVRIVRLLMDQSGGCLPLVELCARYHTTYGADLDVQMIQDELVDFVQVTTDEDNGAGSALIRLTTLQVLGRDIRTLLKKTSCIPLQTFSQAYQEMFFVELKPALYGFSDVPGLLRGLPHIVRLNGRPGRKFVEISPVMGFGSEDDEVAEYDRVSSISRFEDYLSAPVPSAIPSPELHPSQHLNIPDLMKFDSMENSKVWEITDEEKRGLGTPLCRTPTSELMHLASSDGTPSLPSPTLPSPSPHVFPGDVPLTSPFPPPPPFPTDIAPPPLNEGAPFRPLFPPPFPPPSFNQPPPALPPVTPPIMRPPSSSPLMFPYHSSTSPALFPPTQTPVTLEDLPQSSLHWKETLEAGSWSPTPQQLQNLASMGLLGLGAMPPPPSTIANSRLPFLSSRPLSAPNMENASRQAMSASEVETGLQTIVAAMKSGAAASNHVGADQPSGLSNQSFKAAQTAADALCNADPSIIQSSLSTAVPPPPNPPFGVPEFGKGKFVEVKVTSPPVRGYQSGKPPVSSDSSSPSENGTESAFTSPDMAAAVAKLPQEFEESLSLSGDGEEEGNITVLEAAPRTPPTSTSTSVMEVSASGNSSAALPKESSDKQPTMSPAGDAPPQSGAGSIPADDSFSQDHPLDTSSTRSRGSQGSVSDSPNCSPSPRKNPRRSRLAAKFPAPSPSLS